MASNQFELNDPPSDAISAVKYSTKSNKLLVSSWDRNVYLYDTDAASGGKLLRRFEHRAPVLDVCFGDTDEDIFSVGLDWDVRRIHPSGEQSVLSSHASATNAVLYDPATRILISASWDSTLHIHHPYSSPDKEPATLPLPSKPFALSLSPTKLVVAMSTRAVHIYDLPALSLISSQSSQPPPNNISVEPFQRRESSLKFMTRAVACMPRDEGFACSSIEGRVAVEWFDASAESQARKYAFKCHRQPASSTQQQQQQQNGNNGAAEGGEQQPLDIVYPVHALAFHPVHGTFASGGGDGVVTLWDAVAKRRIRQYQQYPVSVAGMSFSQDGKFLAVAVSPGFEDGGEGEEDGDDGLGGKMLEGPVKVFVRELGPTEAKGKGSGK